MDGLRQYAISVIAAALLCGIIIRLTQNCNQQIIRMLCGLFMTIVLIFPLSGNQEILWESLLPDIGAQAEAIAADGTSAAANIRTELIKQRTEAYILDRAEALDTSVTVSVTLGKDDVPVSVRITGSISPRNRSKLTQVIVSELGIPREQQEWIG